MDLGKTYQRRESSMDLDIISDLPIEIVDNILIRLPMQDAMRTSILSKKWRSKWHYTSQLVFKPKLDCDKRAVATPLSRIYKLLLLHRGPLHKFMLALPRVELETENCILNDIILLLTGKCIQQLALYSSSTNLYTLSSTLFQCIQLKQLSLSCCEIRVPPEFTGFSSLISIELFGSIRISANDFKTLISKCPLLQQLELGSQGEGGYPFEIDAPNLKSLCFSCHGRSILLKNVPLLSRLIVHGYDKQAWHSSNTDKVFGSLSSIEYLCASRSFLRFLSADFSAERLPSTLNNLKSVELSYLHLYSLKEAQCVLLLIKRSPNLQKLMIQLHPKCHRIDDKPTLELFETVRLEKEAFFNQLEEVTLTYIEGTMYELKFIELLLAKSLVLKRIILQPFDDDMPPDKVLEILKMNRFQKASPKAKIIYQEE